MHKMTAKEFTDEDFSREHLINTYEVWGINPSYSMDGIIEQLNVLRKLYLEWDYNLDGESKSLFGYDKKNVWWQMIQLLPTSYNQTRNVMLNYEVLANIYESRKDHKLDEWREFCKWIEDLPYSELITNAK